jgi:hypothetical protein
MSSSATGIKATQFMEILNCPIIHMTARSTETKKWLRVNKM